MNFSECNAEKNPFFAAFDESRNVEKLHTLYTDEPIKYVNEKKIICILTRDFNKYWFNFLKTFKCPSNYSIYIIIDKFESPTSESNTNIIVQSFFTVLRDSSERSIEKDQFAVACEGKIKLVQISDHLCIQSKYYKSSSCTNLKDIVAWDKALYYFTCCEKNYEHIWFFEDDVFFYNLDTILNIDTKYPNSDLLSAFHEVNETGNIYNGWNHWCNVTGRIRTPWAHSLISASRLSRRLMEKVDEYVKNNNSLMFIEALFSTLALHNNYIVDNPIELASSITYDKKWTMEEMKDKSKIYHPLKKIEEHEMYRKKMG